MNNLITTAAKSFVAAAFLSPPEDIGRCKTIRRFFRFCETSTLFIIFRNSSFIFDIVANINKRVRYDLQEFKASSFEFDFLC